jgi:antitoxin CptB
MSEAAHQADPVRRRRLRWRARRGLLENDIILTRFLDKFEADLSDGEVTGLNQLLDLTDNTLLELLLERSEPEAAINTPELGDVLARIRNC